MKRLPFLLIVGVLIGVVLYVRFSSEDPPQRGTTLTPKQYIELVEEKKRQRLERQRNQQQAEEADQQTTRK